MDRDADTAARTETELRPDSATKVQRVRLWCGRDMATGSGLDTEVLGGNADLQAESADIGRLQLLSTGDTREVETVATYGDSELSLQALHELAERGSLPNSGPRPKLRRQEGNLLATGLPSPDL